MTRIEARQIGQREANKIREIIHIIKICDGEYTICYDVDLNDRKSIEKLTPGNPEQNITENEVLKKPATNCEPCRDR